MSNYDAGQWSNSDTSAAMRQQDKEITRLKAVNADLLEALMAARDFISTIDEDILPLTDEEEKVSNMVDAAIAKARGDE